MKFIELTLGAFEEIRERNKTDTEFANELRQLFDCEKQTASREVVRWVDLSGNELCRDEELFAMAICIKAMSGLEFAARKRILEYVNSKVAE